MTWAVRRNMVYLDRLPLGFGKNVTDVGIRVPALQHIPTQKFAGRSTAVSGDD